jgi:hypothetical protein
MRDWDGRHGGLVHGGTQLVQHSAKHRLQRLNALYGLGRGGGARIRLSVRTQALDVTHHLLRQA